MFSCGNYLLVISETLRPFVNTLTPKGKDFPSYKQNLREINQVKLSKKLNAFSEFFTALLKSKFNFEHFGEKKLSVIAYVFPKLWTAK